MYLGKIDYSIDTNDRWLLKLACEALSHDLKFSWAGEPEQREWMIKRAEYYSRLFKEN